MLSFAILMGVLIANHRSGSKTGATSGPKVAASEPKKPAVEPGGKDTGAPPVTQIPRPPREVLAANQQASPAAPPAPVEPGPATPPPDPLDPSPPAPVQPPEGAAPTGGTNLAVVPDSPPPPPTARGQASDPLPASDLGPPPGPVAARVEASSGPGIPLAQASGPEAEGSSPPAARNPPDPGEARPAVPSPGPEPPAVAAVPAGPDESIRPAPENPATIGISGRPTPLDAPPPRPLPSGVVERVRIPQIRDDWVSLPNAGKNLDTEPKSPPLALARNTPPTRLTAATAPAPALTPSPAAGAGLDPIEPARHVVQSGENFWTISKLYYGSARYYKALWAANRDRVVAPDKLAVGMAIRVPPPEELDRSLIEVSPPGGSEPASNTRPPRAAGRSDRSRGGSEVELALPVGRPATPPARALRDAGDVADARSEVAYPTHEVREHETLRSIARDTLGDARRASEILEMNRDAIADPRHLTPGVRLVLPDDAQLSRASTRSRN